MCQAMLNHPEFDDYAEEYGSDLRHPNRLVDWWYELAANTSRLIIRDLVSVTRGRHRERACRPCGVMASA
jgi:hypothetical protein